ncbi:MAG: hypothetical protein M1816_007556 [Peltula sp. TS41687]|nr:MAG: hypothetical protein M1816_007556 [Peltula sp. TS41687]
MEQHKYRAAFTCWFWLMVRRYILTALRWNILRHGILESDLSRLYESYRIINNNGGRLNHITVLFDQTYNQQQPKMCEGTLYLFTCGHAKTRLTQRCRRRRNGQCDRVRRSDLRIRLNHKCPTCMVEDFEAHADSLAEPAWEEVADAEEKYRAESTEANYATLRERARAYNDIVQNIERERADLAELLGAPDERDEIALGPLYQPYQVIARLR